MQRIGIIGGGPGGLMVAHLLREQLGSAAELVLLEADERLGGALQTRTFRTAPARYEAGVAECYDYTGTGHDPLLGLLDELGLATRPMEGHAVVLDGTVLRGEDDLRRHAGEPALRALRAFRRRAARLVPSDWLDWSWREPAEDPWLRGSWQDVLDDVPDAFAREYLKVTTHSNLATEPHLTGGRHAIEVALMDERQGDRPRVGVHAIEGGMSELARALGERLGQARVVLGAAVSDVEATAADGYRVGYRRAGRRHELELDALFLALPPGRLARIAWRGPRLGQALDAHVARFDRQGHYLRVSMLFERPFWRELLAGAWFMLEAFGGTCVYDESARYEAHGHGVLGFLFAGSDALALANLDEATLCSRALEALPRELQAAARASLLETRVHRWAMGVSGLPGGDSRGDVARAHSPRPGLFVVGAYLFNGTLNGLWRSARIATELALEPRATCPPRALARRGAGRGHPTGRAVVSCTPLDVP